MGVGRWKGSVLLLFCLLLSGLWCPYQAHGASQDNCDGAEVAIEVSKGDDASQLFTAIPSLIGAMPATSQTVPVPLKAASPVDACSQLEGASELSGSALLVERGSCTFVEKARAAQAANASFLIVYNNEEGCFQMGLNSTAMESFNVSAISVSREAGLQLVIKANAGASALIWMPKYSALDAGSAVLWMMAVATVVGAAVWAGHDLKYSLKVEGILPGDEVPRGSIIDGPSAPGKRHGMLPQGGQARGSSLDVMVVTGASAVAFVALASAMLLLLFYFMNHIFAVLLTVMFCYASAQGLTVVISAVLGQCRPQWQGRTISLPVVGAVEGLSVAAFGPALMAVVVWGVWRQSAWAWPLQDSMGISLILLLLRQFRLPDIKVACILLPLCFMYDIFWVFIEPMIMGGTSVMVEVATGGQSHEMLPILLLVPRFWGGAFGGYNILGFGDLVLPGLLVVYTRMFDLRHRRSLGAGYFVPASAGYGVGLLLTYIALALELGGDQGQPALMYLIPCTLGLVLLLSYSRGNLPDMWAGDRDEAEDICKGRLPSIREEEETDVEHGLLGADRP